MRFCIDYRKLNDVTVKDGYPLPRIDDCLDTLAGAKWFSTMDLSSGYWQVEMEKGSKPKTAFVTRSGLYEFNVLPFGLASAPATFERLMEEVMRGIQWEECLIYLDDIISFGTTFDQELERLIRVFERLKQANLKLKPSKCHLFQTSVHFLGHTVSRDGVSTTDEKIKAVKDWPQPKNVKEVRSFMGLCSYYRKFVQDFAKIARPLHDLTKKNSKFCWTEECALAFENLKTALITAPILAYPLEDGLFVLDTDASKEAVGAVLSQEQEGQEKVIAYFSKSLNCHERQYCITRKEMVAVVYATRKFKSYLIGRPVKLRTDNAAVRYMMSFKEPEGQLARWLEELAAYDLQLIHRAGRSHSNADTLSRHPCHQCGRHELINPASEGRDGLAGESKDTVDNLCTAVTRHQEKQASQKEPQRAIWLEGWEALEIRDSQLRDANIKLVMEAIDRGQNKPEWTSVSGESQELKTLWGQWNRLAIIEGILYRKWENEDGTQRWQMVVPQEKKEEVLHHTHDSPAAGHLGVTRTMERIKQEFFWVGIRKDVRQYCKRCDPCAARKMPAGAPKAPMKEYMSGTPMERIAVDVLGPLTRTRNGNQFVLVIGDLFSKWTEAIAMPNQEAKTVARAVAERWICSWGTPRFLHSDQGRNFESELFRAVMEQFDIKKTRTTPLHPQGNGMVERFNKTLLQMLTSYTQGHPDEWDEHLRFACMAYNSSVHATTGFTPFKLLFGREMRLPIHMLTGDPNLADDDLDGYETYVDELKGKMKAAHEIARKTMKKNMKLYKDRYDARALPRALEVGQAVWVYKPYRKKGVCPKLQCKWDKVYVVTEKLDDVLYRVQKGKKGKGQVVHIQRLMPYHGPAQPKWWRSAHQ